MSSHSVVLVDDHRELVSALGALLGAEDFDVVGRAYSARSGVHAVTRNEPDLAIVDLKLGRVGSGLTIARAARDRQLETSVILYTSDCDENDLDEALELGVKAVVRKDASAINLLEAIAAVLNGGTYVDPKLRRPGPDSRC
jgi:DNA-binding NarL/FixJ family response regulator